jgi:hypothetical protein
VLWLSGVAAALVLVAALALAAEADALVAVELTG